jgi:hypothetical protein
MTELEYERHTINMRRRNSIAPQLRASRDTLLTLALLASVGCDNGESAKPSTLLTDASMAGSQASNNSGTGGAAGQTATPTAGTISIDAGMPDASPTDAGMPVIVDAGRDPVVSVDDDAGPWVPPDPVCVDGRWKLAPGFLLSRKVDYVADRDVVVTDGGAVGTVTLSSAGVPCASATNMANCMAALAEPPGLGRHLVTTAGDNVRLWTVTAARTVLGLIDTAAEAVYWLQNNSIYEVPCTAKITPRDGYFELKGLFFQGGCNASSPPTLYTATVGSDGTVQQITTMPLDGGCPPDASTPGMPSVPMMAPPPPPPMN